MNKNIENFIESLLFASGRPLRLSEIRSILENEGIKADLAEIKVGLNNLEERYAESSLELSEVASGFRLQIKKDFTHLLSSLWTCLLYTSPSPRDKHRSRMPSSA